MAAFDGIIEAKFHRVKGGLGMILSILLSLAAIAGIVYGIQKKSEKWIVGSTVLLAAVIIVFLLLSFIYLRNPY